MLSHKPEERLAAKRLNVWLRNCKKHLYKPSITTQTTLIDHLLVEQEMFPDIQEAITLLNFDELIEEVSEISVQVNNKFKTRMEDIAAKSRKGQELRQAAYNDLKLVVKVMEMLNEINNSNIEVTQCYQLSLVLAELLKNAHTILKSRTTKSKNKKEIDSAIAQLINDTKEGSKKNLPMVITTVKEPSKKIEDDTTQLSEE